MAEITEHEIRNLLRRAIKDAGSQNRFAEQIGVSPQYLSRVVNAEVSPSTALSLAVGVRKKIITKVVYERI